MARKPVGVLPEGGDVVVRADEVRAGMWLLDPETGEWGNVKQAGIGNACVGFGGVRTWRVSLRKLGAREFGVDEQVTVRIPVTMQADSSDVGGQSPREFTAGRLLLSEREIADFGIRADDIDGRDFVFLQSDVERIVTQRVRETAGAAASTAAVDRDGAVEAVLAEMGGHIERASNRVYEWPEDEADLHRNGEHRSFSERSAAVARLRAGKIVDAVLSAVVQESPRVRLEAWIEEQRRVLPEGRTPVAHGKAEVLRDLSGVLDDLFADTADGTADGGAADGDVRGSGAMVPAVFGPQVGWVAVSKSVPEYAVRAANGDTCRTSAATAARAVTESGWSLSGTGPDEGRIVAALVRDDSDAPWREFDPTTEPQEGWS